MNRILIADDNARIRQVLRDLVQGLATEVYEARDGAEAMAVYAMHRPDWVLMDIRMKPMDGLRATRAIKAQFPAARIVIVSNYDESELRAEAAQAGAYAYLVKEHMNDLLSILTEHTPCEPNVRDA